MSDDSAKKDVRILKANYLLRAKVGSGPIDEKKVARSQKLIDGNKIDFSPLAEEFLSQLDAAVKEAAKNPGAPGQIDAISAPVMQIKANAAMFNHALVSRLAHVMLDFLETIEAVDKDVFDIIAAHNKTVRLIVKNKMQGDGGEYGIQLQKELTEACKRYFSKHPSDKAYKGGEDVFFIDG